MGQVKIVTGVHMSILRVVLGVGAFLYGVRALGYWAILQIGGVQPADRSGVEWVLGWSVLLFVGLSVASAIVGQRRSGARVIGAKALFYAGVYGLPAIALFTVASKGAVLRMPEVMGLVMLFACLILAFRKTAPARLL